MLIPRLIVICIAIPMALFCLVGRADEVIPKNEIDRLVKPAVEGQWIKGLAVGLIDAQHQQIVGYGIKSDEDRTAPDSNTVFEIGSVSKTFTATLLADAIVHGEVRLDDPVQPFLPDGIKMPQGASGRQITLLHLTTHSSGLPRMPLNFAPADTGNPYADYSMQQMYAFLALVRLSSEPGDKCVYSNFGVGLLGNILALHANKSYEDLLVSRICKPLKMESTRIAMDESMRRRLAWPYDADGTKLKNWDLPTFAGAGGIRSTVHDMLSYLSAEIELTPTVLSPAIELTHERQREFDKANDIGLGWFIKPHNGYRWHNGQTGGYHSFVAFDMQKQVGVVVLCNTAGDISDAVGTRLIARLNGQDMKPLKLRQSIQLAQEAIDRYVGEYHLGLFTSIVIKKTETGLTARLTGQPAFRIYPESKTQFFWKVVDAQATFEIDADGKVNALVLHQNGSDQRAEKTK